MDNEKMNANVINDEEVEDAAGGRHIGWTRFVKHEYKEYNVGDEVEVHTFLGGTNHAVITQKKELDGEYLYLVKYTKTGEEEWKKSVNFDGSLIK